MTTILQPPVFPFQRNEYIGILGGGQLGRLLAQRAQQLGLQTHVLCYKHTDPAAIISTRSTIIDNDWKDTDALRAFATSGVRWIFCEWENVPVSAVEYIGQHVQVHSMPDMLKVGSSRTAEKTLMNNRGIQTARWIPVNKGSWPQEPDWGNDAYVKITDGEGYDGQGQESFSNWEHTGVKAMMREEKYIVEEKVDLAAECSVIVARDADGNIQTSPALRNKHTDHYGGGILASTSWYPNCVEPDFEKQAQEAAIAIAEYLKLVGTSTVEFFITTDGKLLGNEIAPNRPHNSGHGTLEAADWGQDQFFWYLASVIPELGLQQMQFRSPWLMINLIGSDIDQLINLHNRGWSVHDYSKSAVRPSRKMGHATQVVSDEGEIPSLLKEIKALGFETPFSL